MLAEAFDRPLQTLGGTRPGDGGKATADQLRRIIEGLQGKLLLALEMIVDSPFLKSRDFHDLGHGSGAETALVEERSRLLEDTLPG